jgi:hypothetical protein
MRLQNDCIHVVCVWCGHEHFYVPGRPVPHPASMFVLNDCDCFGSKPIKRSSTFMWVVTCMCHTQVDHLARFKLYCFARMRSDVCCYRRPCYCFTVTIQRLKVVHSHMIFWDDVTKIQHHAHTIHLSDGDTRRLAQHDVHMPAIQDTQKYEGSDSQHVAHDVDM